MKIIYELHPTLSWASPTKTGDIVLSLEEGVSTEIKATLTRQRAIAIRRALGRILDQGGEDPAGGNTIKDLTRLLNRLRHPENGEDFETFEIEVGKAIENYIHLIEYTNAKGDDDD